MKQLVLWFEDKYIDDRAEAYLYIEPFFELAINKNKNIPYELLGKEYDEDEYVRDEQYLEGYAFRLIEKYGTILNEYHGVDFNKNQWIQLMYKDIRVALFISYYIYKRLKLIDCSDLYSLGLKEYNTINKAILNRSFDDLEGNGRGIVYIWSFFADKMGVKVIDSESFISKNILYINEVFSRIKHSIYKRIFPTPRDTNYNNMPMYLVSEKESISDKVDILLYRTNLVDEIEIAKKFGNRIEVINGDKIKLLNDKIEYRYRRDQKLRQSLFLESVNFNNVFERYFNDYYLAHFPVTFLEAFSELYNVASSISKNWGGIKLYSPWLENGLINISAAIARNKGMKLYGMQHSGGYSGAIQTVIGELPLCDKYITWGWKTQYPLLDKKKIVPVGIARLPMVKTDTNFESNIKSDSILFVTSGIWLDHLNEGLDYGSYLNNIIIFLRSVKSGIRKKMRIRTRGGGYLDKLLKRVILNEFPEMIFENGSYILLSESINNCVCVLCDHVGSSELEALLLGKPILKFHAEKITIENPCYKEILEKFRENELYSDNPIKMAEILNQNKNISDWLYNKNIQALYKEYLLLFTGTMKVLSEGAQEEINNKYISLFNGNEVEAMR